jgi:hypothetical protein
MKQLIVLALLVLGAATAHAQSPPTIAFTARLTTAGAPLTGSHQLRFRLFTQVSGGTQRWEENHGSMAVDDGMVHVGLGAITPLTTAILDGTPLFVEVELDGTIMSPRLQLRSVPYAVRATDAAQLGGVASTDYARAAHTHDRMGEIAIGAPVHGALPFAYETIQLNPGHNLRFYFGTDQRMVLGSDGRLQMAQTNGDCPTGWFCNGHFWDLTVASILYSGLSQRSDRRLKDDIRPDDNALAKVRALRPVTFAWKDRPAGATTAKREHGFIAQEVQQVIPELVAQTADGMLSVETTAMIPILAQAVKELDAQNAQLRAELAELRRGAPASASASAASSASGPAHVNRTVLAGLILLVGAGLILLLIRRA